VSGNPVVLVRSKDDQVPIHFQWCRKKGSYPGEPGTFALTKRTVDDFNHIQTATVSINAIDFAWPSVKWSLFEILGHEVGHCLGLQHFFAKPGDLMYLHELSGYGPRDADQAELLKLYSGEKP
jgi:predicted Zn-dependent protease